MMRGGRQLLHKFVSLSHMSTYIHYHHLTLLTPNVITHFTIPQLTVD